MGTWTRYSRSPLSDEAGAVPTTWSLTGPLAWVGLKPYLAWALAMAEAPFSVNLGLRTAGIFWRPSDCWSCDWVWKATASDWGTAAALATAARRRKTADHLRALDLVEVDLDIVEVGLLERRGELGQPYVAQREVMAMSISRRDMPSQHTTSASSAPQMALDALLRPTSPPIMMSRRAIFYSRHAR